MYGGENHTSYSDFKIDNERHVVRLTYEFSFKLQNPHHSQYILYTVWHIEASLEEAVPACHWM